MVLWLQIWFSVLLIYFHLITVSYFSAKVLADAIYTTWLVFDFLSSQTDSLYTTCELAGYLWAGFYVWVLCWFLYKSKTPNMTACLQPMLYKVFLWPYIEYCSDVLTWGGGGGGRGSKFQTQGRGTQWLFVRGGSTARFKPYPFYILFVFDRKGHPFI